MIIASQLVVFLSLAAAPTGVTVEWTAAYRGPGSNYGYPIDLVVDSPGNVYLCGVSEAEPTFPMPAEACTAI